MNEQLINFRLRNKRMVKIAETFVNEWSKLRHLLIQGGYKHSTLETYFVVQQMSKDRAKALERYIGNTPNVKRETIPEMRELFDRQDINVVTMGYPTLADFKVFYYREVTETIKPLLEEMGLDALSYHGNEYNEKVVSALTTLKVTEKEGDTALAIDDEITLLTKLKDFHTNAMMMSKEVKEIIDGYVSKANNRLEVMADKDTHNQYEDVRTRLMEDIESLTWRFTNTICIGIGTVMN